jgi:hypothetical protein
VQLYAFDDGEDLRGLKLSMRKTNLARLLDGVEAAGPSLSGWTVKALDQG